MSAVDRAVIRLAYYELRYRPEIPAKASLNEAVELAKGFGDADSHSFVNGVLDRLARDLAAGKAPVAEPAPEEGEGPDPEADAGPEAATAAEGGPDVEDPDEDAGD
jgi:N utilization substance protein B